MKTFPYLACGLILAGCAQKEAQITPEPPPTASAPISMANPTPTLPPIIVQSKEAAPAAGIQKGAGAKPMRVRISSSSTTTASSRKLSPEEEFQQAKAEFTAELYKTCDGIENASTPAECQQWYDLVQKLQDTANETFGSRGLQWTSLRLNLSRVHTNMAFAASAKKASLSIGSSSTVWQRSLNRARQAISDIENS